MRRGRLLEARFTADFGLTPAEIAALFDTKVTKVEDADLSPTPADPTTYLSGLAPSSAVSAAPAAGLSCGLDLVVALAAKPFVIVTGTSGTGKSRSTLRLAEQLQDYYGVAVDGQIFQLVAIGPDWTSPKKLLGYRTPFGAERIRADGTKTNESYEITEPLRVILRACNPQSTKVPHFLVLGGLCLGGRDVADGLEQPAVVVPVHPFERGVLDGIELATAPSARSPRPCRAR